MATAAAISGPFEAYATALLRFHLLSSEGKDEGPEVDLVQEQMEVLWPQLDADQQRQARGLSSDLNWIQRGGAQGPKAKTRDQVSPEELREFYQFNEVQDFARMLTSLRVCAAAVPPTFVAFARGTCYTRLGLPEVGYLFLRTAIKLGTHESMLSRVAFDALVTLSPTDAFELSNQIINESESYAPIAVAQAVTFAIGFLGIDPSQLDRNLFADKLRQAAKRLDEAKTQREERVRFLMTTGAQLSSFGFVDEGIGYLEQALAVEPGNPELLSWLGEAVYQKDRDRAVSLLLQSIDAGTRLVRPYYMLANHYLAIRDFQKAKLYAGWLVEMAHDNFSTAIGMEVAAICLYEQGANFSTVLGLLKRANQLAPGIQRIANNLASFERFKQSQSASATWETDEPEPFETRERWVSGKPEPLAS